MKLRNSITLLLTCTTLLIACDNDDGNNDDANSNDTSTDVAAEQQADDNYPCTKQVEAVLTFWDNTCWSGGIFCNGEEVTVAGREEGVTMHICDIGPETCDGPGVYTFDYAFEFEGGDCEYCSGSDDKDICVPLNNQCGKETVEITASGSEEGGVHPMWCCPDDPDCV